MRKPLSCRYKSIIQPKYVITMDVHHVVQSVNDRKTVDETEKIVNGMRTLYQNSRYIQLNHYAVRSRNDFQLKNKVGGGNGHYRSLEFFSTQK